MTPPTAAAQRPATVTLEAASLSHEEHFQLLTGAVIPRPIAWTSTVSATGVVNLAPFSFYTVVSTKPPMLALTIEPASDGGMKDTVANIAHTKEFVVNSVSTDLGPAMAHTSGAFAADVDELAASGLHAVRSTWVKPPRVGESRVAMECRLHSLTRPGSDWLVIGEVLAFHLAPGLRDHRGHLDVERMEPLGRVAARFIDVPPPYPLTTPAS